MSHNCRKWPLERPAATSEMVRSGDDPLFPQPYPGLPDDKATLTAQIRRAMSQRAGREDFWPDSDKAGRSLSAVLFLLAGGEIAGQGIHLVLNKRSSHVRQPGDLCCPGGGVAMKKDSLLSRILPLLPCGPHPWPLWRKWRRGHHRMAGRLTLLLAAGLREAWEEMRLNPLRIRFVAPLAEHRLVMFDRAIFPLVGWICGRPRLIPNWEVEKIVRIPLADLLDPARYACYRLTWQQPGLGRPQTERRDFPCFVHCRNDEQELLWGATFRIVQDFLKIVFDFDVPAVDGLPVISGRLDNDYINGTMTGATPDPGRRA